MLKKFYKKYVIDNGIDLKGTDATNTFMHKNYDEATKEVTKEFLTDTIEGVIIKTKTMCMSKFGEEPRWATSEFDSFDQETPLTVYSQGLPSRLLTYNQLKQENSTIYNGSPKNSFVFWAIIYVLVGEEIIKVAIRGGQLTNWFTFTRAYLEIEGVNTKFKIVKSEKGYNELEITPLVTQPENSEKITLAIEEMEAYFEGKKVVAPIQTTPPATIEQPIQTEQPQLEQVQQPVEELSTDPELVARTDAPPVDEAGNVKW